MERNKIIYIIAAILQLIGTIACYYNYQAAISFILLISSYVALILLDKDKRISIVQFILIGIVGPYNIFCILGSILFIALAVLTYFDYKKEKNENINNIEIKKDNKLWLLPVITLILIFLSAFILNPITYDDYNYSDSSYVTVELSNITNDIRISRGYAIGSIEGILTTNDYVKGVQIQASFYTKDDVLIGSGTDYSLINTELSPNQKYKININCYEKSTEKPVRAVITVNEDYSGDLLYKEEINL